MAPISTNKYGKTFINSTLYVSFNAATYPLVITVSNIIVMIAAGKTIAKFTLNLSLISQPWVLVAAIVVSEIIDKLSPNIAPPTTAPKTKATGIPVFDAIATPIGPMAAIVPTDVPIDIDIKHPITNKPVTNKLAGTIDNPKETTASAPPIAFATPLKAPANKNINNINIISLFPPPLQNTSNFVLKSTFLLNKNATAVDIIKATKVGIL